MDLRVGESLAEYINSGKALAIIGVSSSPSRSRLSWVPSSCTSLASSSRLITPSPSSTLVPCGRYRAHHDHLFRRFQRVEGERVGYRGVPLYLEHNMGSALLYTLIGWTLLMALLQHLFRVNILRVIVLAGTAALAMAFAGTTW